MHVKNLFIRLFLLIMLLNIYKSGQSQTDTTMYDAAQDIAFLTAIFQKDTARVEEMIAAGANVNSFDYNGVTALMFAILSKELQIIDLLLQHGADVNIADNSGATALMYAVNTGDVEVVGRILPLVTDINHRNKDGYTALMYSARGGDIEMAQALIDRGADVSLKNSDGVDALMYASAFGHFSMVDMLIFYGSVLSNKARDGSTALHLAAYYGHSEVAGLLIESGANPNATDNRGHTPLMAAILSENVQAVWYLLESGAKPDTFNRFGQTPLALAAGLNNLEMVRLITSYDFDEPIVTPKRNTSLAMAFISKNHHIPHAIRQFAGVRPQGLYFSELTAEGGLTFNSNELMSGFGIGLFESRYGVLARVSRQQRSEARVVDVLVTDNLTYRYHESRTVWSFSFQKNITMISHRQHRFGCMVGAAMFYSTGRYRGVFERPEPILALSPVIDFYYRYRWISVFGGYSLLRTGVSGIPAERYIIGVRVSMPLFTQAFLGYRPIIR